MSLSQLLAKAKAPKSAEGPIRISGYLDWFKLRDAPYVMEERLSESGRSYARKVFLPEAYTAEYMEPSDETGRLVRWGVKLSDGRMVSRDGAIRLRFPERWEQIRKRLAGARGDRRSELAAEILWKGMEPAERDAMIASMDLLSYADERGVDQAKRDLVEDLKQSGSLLYWLSLGGEVDLYRLLSDAYVERYLGGQDRWPTAPWREWITYKMAKAGAEIDTTEVSALPMTRKILAGKVAPHLWWGALPEYTRNARGQRLQEIPRLRAAIEHKVGGPVTDWRETESAAQTPESRRELFARVDARVARMPDASRRALSSAGADRYKVVPAILRAVWTAFREST